MEHFFNRKPTKGYIEYVELEDLDQGRENGSQGGDVIVPYHISKAACYVEDARDGRLANGKGKMSDMSHRIQLCFFIQTHTWWSRFIYISVVFMSALVFFEPSSSAAITFCNGEWFNFSNSMNICRKDLIIPWQEWTLFIEILMISVFISDVLMKQAYMKPHVYWTKKWHKISGFFILLFIFDWFIFLLTYSITKSGIRFSRPFRPILLLTRYRELRRILETLLSMKKDLIQQIFIIIVYIVLFAWAGVTLFGGTYRFTRQCVDINIPEVSHQLNVLNNASYCIENTCWNTTLHPFCVCGEEQFNDTETGCKHISGDGISVDIKHHYLPEDYGVFDGSFSNILIGSVRLMVHISTENYPDFILPAYKRAYWSAVYFVLFMFIGMFLLMSVLLAVIVEFWLTYLKKTNDNEKRKERLGITKAFTWIDAERNYVIDEESWNQLILLLKKDFTKTQSQFMFDILDWEDKGHLDVLDFLNITEALTLHYNVRNMASSIENSRYGDIARKILGFKYDFSCGGLIKTKTINIARIAFGVVALHTVLALACTLQRLEIMTDTATIILRTFNSFLLILLVIEQGLRLLSKGFHTYLQNLNNRWEIVTVAVAFISMIGYWITFGMIQGETDEGCPACILKNLLGLSWELLIILRPSISGAIIIFFYKVINVLSELFFFIVIIVYVFGVIGLELFAIHSNNPDENYFQQFDCGIGFESPGCATMTMWQQITTSNWHDMMNSVAQASGEWAYVYFCVFYITINLVLLDLTIAMTIEMYNAIKSQYFTNKSSDEGEESEGVVFQIQSQDPYYRHEAVTGGRPTNRESRKKSSGVVCYGLGLQVTKSESGSWRKSVLDSDAGKISTEDLDKIQKSIEGEKIGHGKDKGQLYMNSKDSEINVRQMYGEKENESKSLDQPECVLHFWFPIVDYQGKELGEMVMEMKDHHSHDCNIKLNFNTSDPSLHPLSGQIYCEVNKEEQIYMENITFLNKQSDDLINTDYDWHGFQTIHWTIKKSQRVQLKKDNIKFRILLYDVNKPDADLSESSDEEAKKMILSAHIRGYDDERKRWDEKQKQIKQTRKKFGEISFLLQKNAYRVSIKQQQWGDEGDDAQKEDTEKRLQGKRSKRQIYVMSKDDDDRDQEKAYSAWKRSLTIERSATNMRKEEAKGKMINAVRRVSVLSSMMDPALRAKLLSQTPNRDEHPPTTSTRGDSLRKLPKLPLPPIRSMSIADIMVGATKDPNNRAKLASLSLSVMNARSLSRSTSPRSSIASPSFAEEDPMDAGRHERNNETESESSDEIHSDDSSNSEESSDFLDSDDSEKIRERLRKNSRSGSTGSIYDKIRLGIKATRRSLTPSPTPKLSLQVPADSSDPQTSPTSAKTDLEGDPLLKPPQPPEGTARSFPTTPEPKNKTVLGKLKRAISRPAELNKVQQPPHHVDGTGLTVVITAPDQDQNTVETEEQTHTKATRAHSAPPNTQSEFQGQA